MRRQDQGVTLVEMLVALSMFSFIALSCTVLLRLGLNSGEQLEETSGSIAEFQLARALIKSDLVQITARKYRNMAGGTVPTPMVGGVFNRGSYAVTDQDETILMALVTNGRTNPDDIFPQSSLQYTEYLLVDSQLIRRVASFPDRLSETPVTDQVLFENIDNATIRFLDGPRWTDQWQSRGAAVAPRAIEIEFDHLQYGSITQLFYIPRVAG